jgi:hypothetical protein
MGKLVLVFCRDASPATFIGLRAYSEDREMQGKWKRLKYSIDYANR